MSETERRARRLPPAARIPAILALLFLFMLGVHGLGSGFKLLGRDLLESFFSATSNPLVALLVGILATTLVQSSSVTTSMIVGLVAAPENPLPLANAVPMVMGANVGTTVTNTIVSLAHLGRPEEFRRAFSAATCHDFFNYFAVLVLLPIEIATGYLMRSARFLARSVEGVGGVEFESPLKGALEFSFAPFGSLAAALFSSPFGQALFLIMVSGVFIFTALFLLVRLLSSIAQNRVENVLGKALDASPLLAILVGIIVTVMVQSSSITTSILVPLAGAGVITLEQVFPVTLGANIGTTVTGFVAALAVSGPNAGAGVEIALVHFLFNITGILLVFPVRSVRRLPLRAARWLADQAVLSRKRALLYVAGMFYLLPALLVAVDHWLSNS